MEKFQRPLKVGKTDNYTLTMSRLYLDNEVVATSAASTTDTGILTVENVSNSTTEISALCTGVAAGEATIHIEWTTPTRSGCDKFIIVVEDC